MLADPVTGFLMGQTAPGGVYQEFPIGGTSLSSPMFMASMALAQQYGKKTFGFANPAIYKAYKKGAFSDVLPLASPQAVAVYPGVVTTFDYEATSIHTLVGYDTMTGLGAPNGKSFLTGLK
jgi:subtilase family serine protease